MIGMFAVISLFAMKRISNNMKKILSTIAIIAVALVCLSFSVIEKSLNVDVREVNVGGHKYVIVTSYNMSKQGGVGIVHSAGCYCNNK